LYNIGELQFTRYRIDLGHATTVQIQEALAWYEASIRFGEWLGGQFDLYWDYCRAVECITCLLKQPSNTEDIGMSRELVSRGQRYLAVTCKCPPASWQWQMVKRVESAFAAAVAELTALGSQPPGD
jgi:hypothetical protein